MSGKLDQISGNVKEKAGELLDDPKLEAEGLIQQGIGKFSAVAKVDGQVAVEAIIMCAKRVV